MKAKIVETPDTYTMSGQTTAVPVVPEHIRPLPAEIVIPAQGAQVQRVLADLLPAINAIHGGCAVCRNHFKDTANAVLEADGVPYRYSEKLDARGKPVRGPDGQMLNLVIVAA
jgi:hypothetical protein